MIVTVTGNLTSDPEVRYVEGSGKDVANFTVAESDRKFNRDTNQWEDGAEPSFWRCNVWGDQAGRAAEFLVKGQHVIVVGKLKTRSYEDREGVKRTVTEIAVDHVGPSLRLPGKGPLASSSQYQPNAADRDWAKQATADPWATAPTGEPPY